MGADTPTRRGVTESTSSRCLCWICEEDLCHQKVKPWILCCCYWPGPRGKQCFRKGRGRMVSGPEKACLIIHEFEGSTEKRQATDGRHYEQKRHTQIAFTKDIRPLSWSMEEMGNPFAKYSSDFLVRDSRDVMNKAVADTIGQIEKLGFKQYKTYVEERLVN